jgi:hypothetical protein
VQDLLASILSTGCMHGPGKFPFFFKIVIAKEFKGAGLLYVPSLALVGLSFSSKRALAQGIVTSGIAVGK